MSTRGLLRRKRNSKSEQYMEGRACSRKPSELCEAQLNKRPGLFAPGKGSGSSPLQSLPESGLGSALRFLAWILVLAPAFLPWPRSLWDVDHALSRPDQHHNPQQHIPHQLGFSYCSPETARRSSRKKVRARLLSLRFQCQELSRFAKRAN